MRVVDLTVPRQLLARSFWWWSFTLLVTLLYFIQRVVISIGLWLLPGVLLRFNNRLMYLLSSILIGAYLTYYYSQTTQQKESLSWGQFLLYHFIKLLPRRLLSRLIGCLFRTRIHSRFVRRILYKWWCRHYKVITSELLGPLEQYPSLDAFFTRKVNLSTRKNYEVRQTRSSKDESCYRFVFNKDALIGKLTPNNEILDETMIFSGTFLFSPADSILSSYGVFSPPFMQNLTCKGLLYSAADILGLNLDDSMQDRPHLCKESVLHWMVFYLSPGDYHHFHSPCDISVTEYSHIYGDLLPVNSVFLPRVKGLLAANERVVLSGSYRLDGNVDSLYFGYVAVGALNVGNISIRKTGENLMKSAHAMRSSKGIGKYIRVSPPKAEVFSTGEEVGTFHFGSTIVLIYEVPLSYRVVHLSNEPNAVRVGDEVTLIIKQ